MGPTGYLARAPTLTALGLALCRLADYIGFCLPGHDGHGLLIRRQSSISPSFLVNLLASGCFLVSELT